MLYWLAPSKVSRLFNFCAWKTINRAAVLEQRNRLQPASMRERNPQSNLTENPKTTFYESFTN